jgi:ABC-type multidrug transport system ATPase subunit
VGQLDEHFPFLTVRETFDFAFQCRTGGKLGNIGLKVDDKTGGDDGTGTAAIDTGGPPTTSKDSDAEGFTENLTIKGLDLSVCADTFVGNDKVRGVSGGQRRRVTVGTYRARHCLESLVPECLFDR